MPSKKKKTKNSQTKAKKSSTKRPKKSARPKQARTAKKSIKKKQSKKKSVPAANRKKPVRSTQRSDSWDREGATPAQRAEDFQGLSRAEQADSESVDELVEEGNVFEAGAVAGVEEADNEDTREVHTHEVPEDDVPEEYLDKD